MEHKFEGIFAELVGRTGMIEKILAGDTADEIPDGLENTLAEPVLDENTATMVEREALLLFIARKLGSDPEQALVVARLRSADGMTTVDVFGSELGVSGEFLFSRWQNAGEKPSWVLWPKDNYAVQILGDEENPAPFKLVDGNLELQ